MSDVMSPPPAGAGASRAERFKDALLQGQSGPGWAVAPLAAPAAPAVAPLVPGPVRPWSVQAEPNANVGGLAVPYAHVIELRQRVAEQLAQASADTPGMSLADRRQLGQSLVNRVVAEWATAYAATAAPLSAADERAVRSAVFAELFQAGRLQPYLDDSETENIIISGHDSVTVDYRDRPARRVGRIAESDGELIELINQLVRTQGQGERSLTPASPLLNTRLADGSRLAATAYVTPVPEIVIRRHRTRSQGLADLQAWGTIDATLAAFLRAAVLAGKNIVVAGSQGVGKTSLMRALGREIPSSERVVTLEGEYELWLHTDPDGPTVVAMEAREGNGERGPDGRPSGEITLDELFVQSLRMSARRVIVGEVRGKEVLPMLHAMGEGEGGSMCTLHAKTAEMAVERLVLLAMQAEGTQMTDSLAYRLVANAVDLIVYLSLVDETAIGGSRHRFVSQVVEITGVGEGGRPSRQHIFGPREEAGRREVRAVPLMAPQCLPDLERVGFDRRLLQQPWGAWERPLRAVSRL
ncbi:Flp pilus assembly CpaF family ATPase [Kitasatospora sp. GAS204A]|uniref:CpaF family protein n=1 Tax=unclassified Kitasatospora TaxID=2633591 RepID=UPI002475CA4A|nr:CpaF/VirB11 family protein [Kitasatospora sp. GAS204B]MDH6122721.1 Flp pilus assembly CpaF family ATPase [Kitasatospora sp. GAS204B]